jgi:hypothetical protein
MLPEYWATPGREVRQRRRLLTRFACWGKAGPGQVIAGIPDRGAGYSTRSPAAGMAGVRSS